MEKEKANLCVKIEVKSTNYQNGNVMEAEGKLKTVFGGRGQVTEDSLSFKGSDCGKASMEANYNSSATGEGEKNTEVELDIKGGIINAKKELIDAISAGAKSKMPIMDAFWGDRFGSIEDPFGHVWSIATHKKDMTPDEIKKAGEEFMKQMKQH